MPLMNEDVTLYLPENWRELSGVDPLYGIVSEDQDRWPVLKHRPLLEKIARKLGLSGKEYRTKLDAEMYSTTSMLDTRGKDKLIVAFVYDASRQGKHELKGMDVAEDVYSQIKGLLPKHTVGRKRKGIVELTPSEPLHFA